VRRGGAVEGVALDVAAQIPDQARPGEVALSGSVPPLIVGSGIDFRSAGEATLTGLPSRWALYVVDDGSPTVAPGVA